MQNPDINYLAIDIKSEVLGLAKRNVEKEYEDGKRKIDNVLLTAYEIQIIQNILNEKDEVERIYINFCNPWPRGKHHKKRLTHTKQLEHYKDFLEEGNEIYFKTDDDGLFEDSLKYFEESGFEILNKTYDLHVEDIFAGNLQFFARSSAFVQCALYAQKHL